MCLAKYNLRCIWNIRFIDRFLGNENILYCSEYAKIMNNKKNNKKGSKK